MARVALTGALIGFALIYQAGWVSGGGISCEVSWKTPGTSGNWNTATNWVGDQLPAATDNACLPTSGTAYTVAVENMAVADGIIVNPGATLQVKATGGVATLTTTGSVFNAGSVVIGQAPLHSVATISVGGTFYNDGSFSTANIFNHLGANIVNAATGTFTVAAGSNLTNGKASATFANSGTMTVDGQFDILTNVDFTMNVGSSLLGNALLHVIGGNVDHLGGSVTAPTALEGVLLKPHSTSGTGTLRVVKGSNWLMTDVSANDIVIVEGGFENIDGTLGSTASRINNGTIKLSSSSSGPANLKTAMLSFSPGQTLTNMGTLQTTQGAGANTTPARVISRDIINAGTFRVDYPTTYLGPDALVQNTGSTVLTSNLDISSSGVTTFDLNGGTFSGTGKLIGNLQNDGGTVAPGESPGVLSVHGNFTQGAGGTLAIELSGLNPGSENDRFHVDYVATLGGTLAVSRLGGFSPSLSFSYDYLLYDLGATGNFSAITGTNAGTGKTFVNTLQSGKATLTVVGSATRKPDGKIALDAVANPFVGDNIYNLDGTNQSKSKNVGAGKTATFFIKLQNDGSGAKDRFKLKATGTTAVGFTFKCFRGTTNVTTAVNNGTFLTGKISVGGSKTIKCTIAVASNAGLGVVFNRLITITSNNNSAAKDAVKMTVVRT